MSSPCRDCQERLIAHAGDRSAFEPDLAQHVNACEACASFARRSERQVSALAGLERRVAPVELDGRVVAACHGGHRQERATAQLRALNRWSVPAELDARVLDQERERIAREASKAPSVLDRLVDEDLRDPPKALAQRFAGRLERLRAPGVLRVRVERTAGNRFSLGRRRLRVLAAASLLVVLLFSIGGGIYWLEKPRYSFEVVYESSLDGLQPVAGALLGGLTGGMTDAVSPSGVKR
jgi:hypothetical protein